MTIDLGAWTANLRLADEALTVLMLRTVGCTTAARERRSKETARRADIGARDDSDRVCDEWRRCVLTKRGRESGTSETIKNF